MRNRGNQSDNIKAQAGSDVVIFLESWKKMTRRRKIYRVCLFAALIISSVVLTSLVYYYINSSIPSVINIRAGQEESFFLGVPAKAEIVSVSESGSSNIPEGAVDIDLSKAFTLQGVMEDSYQLQDR